MRKVLTSLIAAGVLATGTVAQAETRSHATGYSTWRADSSTSQDDRRKRRGLFGWLVSNGISVATALAIIAIIASSSGGSNGNSPR